ncbi:MAG TPA: acetyl-CoA acetyltransferase [Acidimicrobiales bacterium]|nr:acetyl-CoA acetyltransferase [Acidimicrobiales bacterium]
MDPRTPVLVGVGQLNQRVDRGEPALEPAALMAEALRRAAGDAGAPGLLGAADSIRTVALLSWRYRNPGAVVATLLGIDPADTAVSAMGGNSPQSLVNTTCLDILEGRAETVLLAGAEAWRTRTAARDDDVKLDWTVEPEGAPPARLLGADVDMNHRSELGRGVMMPVQVYPLFEQALRHASDLDDRAHRTRISELWSRFSEVAASNPNAWIQKAFSAEVIATAGPDNRMVGYPYTKLMNSNNAVEQSAALILTSVERAESLGVDRDRWVFPLAGTDARDHVYLSERADLHSSPAIRHASRACLDLGGVGVDDLAHVDLYSCFPSAVQIGANEIGLPLDRQLTVTGGLSFAGGPWNNYVMHAIATMADVLRADPGSIGLCTANGGYTTKHAFGLYSTEPAAEGFRHASPQDAVDALPRRTIAADYAGPATLESHTVMHDRESRPEIAIAAVLTPEGGRGWATSTDDDVKATLVGNDLIGDSVTVDADGALRL